MERSFCLTCRWIQMRAENDAFYWCAKKKIKLGRNVIDADCKFYRAWDCAGGAAT